MLKLIAILVLVGYLFIRIWIRINNPDCSGMEVNDLITLGIILTFVVLLIDPDKFKQLSSFISNLFNRKS